jgi:hypothetical protein
MRGVIVIFLESCINQPVIINRSCSESIPSPALRICECLVQLLNGICSTVCSLRRQ